MSQVRTLPLAIKALSILAFLTGGMDMLGGVQLLVAGGSRLGAVANDPVLNSQVGFWGAIWFGFGVLLWRTSGRLVADAGLFRILCAIVLLSGLARLKAAVVFGLPGAPLTVAMFVEIVAGTGLFFWHAAMLRRDRGVPT